MMRIAFAFLITLAACSEFPELEGTVEPAHAQNGFPDLIPLAPLVAQANAATRSAPAAAADLSPRLANLNARAARLRGPVIPAPQRTRMLRAMR